MSMESKLYMVNIEKWMDELAIMKFFKEYNFNPKSIELVKNENKGYSHNFCFINFFSMNEANNALTFLNGKYIPNTNLTFNLKWANRNSKNTDIFVGNISPEIDNVILYNLFKEKYPSVHHAFIVRNSNKITKGYKYGFINFLDKEEAEKCIKEMNGYIFYNKALKVEEKRNNYHKKKEGKNQKNTKERLKNEFFEEIEKDEEIEEDIFENEEKTKNTISGIWTFKDLSIELIGVLKGHTGPVTSLVYSEDTNGVPLLFSGSEDSTIIQWELFFKDNKFQIEEKYNSKENVILGKPKNILKEHEDAITSISIHSEQNLLISSSLDKKIIIKDINFLTKEPIIIKSKNEVLSVNVGSNIIFSGEKNKQLKIFNLKGDIIYIDKHLDGYVTCCLKIIQKEKNQIYFAFGLSSGKVIIYNEELNLIKEIPYRKLKNRKDNLKINEEEQKSVASLTTDEVGEYLFIGYKNGIIMIYCIEDIQNNDYKEFIQNVNEIKKILFETKFFNIIFIGDKKGFQIRAIEGKESLILNDISSCLSLCFGNNKNYLFAGFGDGIIRIYEIYWQNK